MFIQCGSEQVNIRRSADSRSLDLQAYIAHTLDEYEWMSVRLCARSSMEDF